MLILLSACLSVCLSVYVCDQIFMAKDQKREFRAAHQFWWPCGIDYYALQVVLSLELKFFFKFILELYISDSVHMQGVHFT